jgi:hypothetical protein
MYDWPSEIRRLIEAEAPPISIGEIRQQKVRARTPHRRSRIGAVALGLVGLIVLGLMIATMRPGPPMRPKASTVLEKLPESLRSCLANPAVGQDGCPASASLAETMLGVRIPQPSVVPSGWVVIKQDVRRWPSNYSELRGAIPADFNQVWAAPDTNLNAAIVPTFIQYNVQSASNYTPQETKAFTALMPAVTLPTGMLVYGTLAPTYCALNWVAGDEIFRLRTGAPMSVQNVELFIDSLK